MKANKVVPKFFIAVRLLCEIHPNKPMEQPIRVGWLEGRDWFLHSFIEVNVAKLTDSNQIFRNDFAFIITSVKFQLKLRSANFFLPMISCNELYN